MRHVLSHLAYAIRKIEILEYLIAGVFEGSRKQLKSLYENTFKGGQSPLVKSSTIGTHKSLTKGVAERKFGKQMKISSRVRCAREKRPVLVGTKRISTLLQLQTLLWYALKTWRKIHFRRNHFFWFFWIIQYCQGERPRTFLRLLQENVKCCECWIQNFCKREIHLFVSAYTTSIWTPTSDCPSFRESIFLEKTCRRKLQKVSASRLLQGAGRIRFNVARLDTEEDFDQSLPKDVVPNWFAKVLCFWEFRLRRTSAVVETTRNWDILFWVLVAKRRSKNNIFWNILRIWTSQN